MNDMLFNDQCIKVGDVNTRYWSAGDKGSPVILLHGVGFQYRRSDRLYAHIYRAFFPQRVYARVSGFILPFFLIAQAISSPVGGLIFD